MQSIRYDQFCLKTLHHLVVLNLKNELSCYFEGIQSGVRSPSFVDAPNLCIWSGALLSLISRLRNLKNSRLVFRRLDTSFESGEFGRFNILCHPKYSVNLFALIVYEHSITTTQFGHLYGEGFEHMLKASLEVTQDSDVLISLYYKAPLNDAFKQMITAKFDRLSHSIYWEIANTLHTSSKLSSETSNRWELIAKDTGVTTRGGFSLLDFIAFKKILENVSFKAAEKKSHQVWVCPEEEFLNASFRPQELMINFRFTNLDIKYLLVRLYLDVISSENFHFAPYISRYAIFTVENRGPFYFSVYLSTTKVLIPLLDEIRVVFFLFLKSIGYDDPYAHISISAKGKDNQPLYQTPLNASAHTAVPLIKSIDCRQIVCESEPRRVSSTIKRSKSSRKKTNKIACEPKSAVHNDVWADYIETEIDSVHKIQESVDKFFASWSLYECIEEWHC